MPLMSYYYELNSEVELICKDLKISKDSENLIQSKVQELILSYLTNFHKT